MIGTALLFLVALLIMQAMGRHAIEKLRCVYCGKVAAHEEHCPFNREEL